MAKSVLSDNPVRFVRCKVCLIRHGFGEKKTDCSDLAQG